MWIKVAAAEQHILVYQYNKGVWDESRSPRRCWRYWPALALLLKPNCLQVQELSLYDIAPVTPGVAVDLSHIPTAVKIKGFSGEDATPALEGADVVLISAGVARKPGMDRSDLF